MSCRLTGRAFGMNVQYNDREKEGLISRDCGPMPRRSGVVGEPEKMNQSYETAKKDMPLYSTRNLWSRSLVRSRRHLLLRTNQGVSLTSDCVFRSMSCKIEMIAPRLALPSLPLAAASCSGWSLAVCFRAEVVRHSATGWRCQRSC